VKGALNEYNLVDLYSIFPRGLRWGVVDRIAANDSGSTVLRFAAGKARKPIEHRLRPKLSAARSNDSFSPTL
jgi:hypothetical protein